MDTDGSGEISGEELYNFFDVYGGEQYSDDYIQQTLWLLDLDGNNVVDLDDVCLDALFEDDEATKLLSFFSQSVQKKNL